MNTFCKLFFTVVILGNTGLSAQTMELNYPFNGNANDLSANSYNGSVNGAILCPDRDGNLNSAYLFDGINDYISIGTTPFFSSIYNSFSVSFWMKSDNTGITHQKGIFGTINTPGTGYTFQILAHGSNGVFYYPNTLYFYLRDISGKAFTFTVEKPSLFNNAWHCVTIVMNNLSNNDALVYIDGIPHPINIHVDTNPGNWGSFEFTNVIGAINNRGTITDFFPGSLDDFRVYDYSLDSNTVMNNCENTTIGIEDEGVSIIKQARIYPNPVMNEMNIEVNNGQLTSMSIYNSLGQTMYNGSIPIKMDISTYLPGIYHVVFQDIKANTYNTKFIKQ